jgi:hypothetical protein
LNIESVQADLGIEVILKLFSKEGFEICLSCEFKILLEEFRITQKRIYALQDEYLKQSIPVAQGKNPTLALRFVKKIYQRLLDLQLEELDWAFGTMGTQDKAKHLATLYLEYLIFYCGCGCNFGFSRYAERLGRSANSFDELYEALKEPTYIDILLSILKEK